TQVLVRLHNDGSGGRTWAAPARPAGAPTGRVLSSVVGVARRWCSAAPLSTCERVGDAIIGPRLINTIGWVYAELHDFERALEWNLRGLAAARAVRAPVPEVE